MLILFIGIQFIRIDRTNPKVVKKNDFIAMTKPDKDIEGMIRSACYDCHSNETEHPWYTNIAPVSWWIGNHIKEGREHLNFSEWAKYSEEAKNHKLHECEEELEEGKMPLDSYTWTHGDAKLSKKQKEKLAEWFEDQMTSESEEEHEG